MKPESTVMSRGLMPNEDLAPNLADEVRRLRADNERLREALQAYMNGHPCNDTGAQICPTHKAARAALAPQAATEKA